MANLIVAQMLFLESENPDKDINLYINSPGGSVTAGMSIYDTMQFIRPNVSTLCIGQAASMGAFLLAAGHPEKRFCATQLADDAAPTKRRLKGRSLRYRDPSSRDFLLMREQLNQLIAHHTGKTTETVAKDTDRDFWMSPNAALEYGLIDKVQQTRAQITNTKD